MKTAIPHCFQALAVLLLGWHASGAAPSPARVGAAARVEETVLRLTREGVTGVGTGLLPDLHISGSGSTWHVVVDGVVGPALAGIVSAGPVVSDDGHRVGYVLANAGGELPVVDGRQGPAYDEVEWLGFAPGSNRFAYVARKARRRVVVVENSEPFDCDEASPPVFNADGTHFAFAAAGQGARFIVHDGVPGEGFLRVGQPVLSRDGRRLAHAAGSGYKWFVVSNDGQRRPAFDAVADGGIAFSPITDSIAYVVRDKDKWRLAWKGTVGRRNDVVGPPVFTADGRLVCWASPKRTGSVQILVEGGSVAECGQLTDDGVVVSLEGAHFACGCRSSGGNAWHVLADGQPSERYDWIGRVAYQGDSTLVYAARLKWSWVVVKDGKPLAAHLVPAGARLAFSPDAEHLAWRVSAGDQTRVVVDGHEVGRFDEADDPVFSQHGGRCAMRVRRGEDWSVVIDTLVGPAYSEIPEHSIAFSRDGKHVAYAGARASKEILVRDGMPGPPHEHIIAESLIQSPDLLHVAYVAVDSGRTQVVLDGKASRRWDEVSGMTFEPDGGRLAYIMRSGSRWGVALADRCLGWYDEIGEDGVRFTRHGKHLVYTARSGQSWSVYVDGEPGPPHSSILDPTVSFSANEAHHAYVVRRAGRSFVVVDGTQVGGGGFEEISRTSLCLSDDGQHLAFAARSGSSWFVVRDGRRGGSYARILDVLPGGPGGGIYYRAQKGKQWCLVHDDTELARWDAMGSMVMSADGKHIAYAARQGDGWHVVVDGLVGPRCDSVRDGTVRLSPDGARVAYVATDKGRPMVVVDGQALGPYDEVEELAFSPDGAHVSFKAPKEDGTVVVLDGREGPAYDEIVAGPVYLPGGAVEYIAAKGEERVRVVQWPE